MNGDFRILPGFSAFCRVFPLFSQKCLLTQHFELCMIKLVKDQSLTGLPVGLFLLDVQAGACAFAGRRCPVFLPAGILLAGGGREGRTERRLLIVAKMTAKQQRFCDEYLIDLNATQAAIRAGYSERTAGTIGNENMQKPAIRAYINERMAEKEKSLIADQDEILKYLTAVMRGKSQSTEIVVEGTGEGCSEARTMQKEPSEKDRLKAAELLGKRYGLYTEKMDVEGAIPVVISGGEELED